MRRLSQSISHPCSRLALAALLLAATGVGCSRRVETRPPDGLDYAFPEWRSDELERDAGRRLRELWESVVTGDAAYAEQELRRLLRRHPGQRSLETALAYALMRGGRWQDAEARFLAVLARRPDYLPALVGAGSLALRAGEAERALELYRRGAEQAPRDRLIERRWREAQAQVLERRVADARDAQARGDAAAAEAAYRAALAVAPGVGGVRAELARLLHRDGRGAEAVALLEAAPGAERSVLEQLARIRIDTGELEQALAVFRELIALAPDDAELRDRADAVRRQLELLSMPEAYRLIPEAERVSRADLAALIATKVTALGRLASGETPVLIDVVGERWAWAEPSILRVVELDILSVYSNHTFQPQATLRREELAHAVGRVLDLLEYPEQPLPQLKDVRPSHLFYRGVTRSVAAGLLGVTPAGAFEGWRPVSGRDAVAVIEALASLLGP